MTKWVNVVSVPMSWMRMRKFAIQGFRCALSLIHYFHLLRSIKKGRKKLRSYYFLSHVKMHYKNIPFKSIYEGGATKPFILSTFPSRRHSYPFTYRGRCPRLISYCPSGNAYCLISKLSHWCIGKLSYCPIRKLS